MTIDLHRRRSIRLNNYDYTSHGAYFITIVAKDRRALFGRIENDSPVLTVAGRIVEEEWLRTGDLRNNVQLDAYVIMPNHVHLILFLMQDDGAEGSVTGFQRVVPGSVPAIVRAFKAATTRRLRLALMDPDLIVWQRNYFERVVRNEHHLATIRQYVADNPRRWVLDRENPDAAPGA